MNKLITLFFLHIMLFFMACGEKNPGKAIPSQTQSEETRNIDLADDEYDGNAFERYNEVKKVLTLWNNAIDSNLPENLTDVYADEVIHYTKAFTKEECIAAKTAWLSEHHGYKQQMKEIEIYYMDEDTSMSTFYAEFIKVCIDKNSTVQIPSLLSFSKFGDTWKITKETDRPTEIARAKRAPISTLKNGIQTFYQGFWEDTRDIPEFAHDMVPYNFTLTLDVGQKITGNFAFYSGTARSISHYLIPSGKIENGILELVAMYNENEEISVEEYEPSANDQIWRLKIISGDELVGLDASNPYLGGRSLVLQKK